MLFLKMASLLETTDYPSLGTDVIILLAEVPEVTHLPLEMFVNYVIKSSYQQKKSEEPSVPIEINGQPYYSPSEVMEILGVSRGMLLYYRREGDLPGGYKVGLALYHTQEEIEHARQAIAKPKKRGPKTGPKKRGDEEGEGTRASVTYASSSYSAVALEATA